MRRFFLVWVAFALAIEATRAQEVQDFGAKEADDKDDYYYSYYDIISDERDKDSSNDVATYDEDQGDWGDVLDENNFSNQGEGLDYLMEYGQNPDQYKKTTEFCPWPPCYNIGESKSFDEILDIKIETTPEPEPELYQYPEQAILEEVAIVADGEEVVEEIILTEVEDDVEAIDYDYEAGAKELEPDCQNTETVIIYRSEAPNGVIIASVVFFVIIVGVLFYMPRFIKMRQSATVSARAHDSAGLIEVPQFDPGHDGYDSDIESQAQYVANIRDQPMPSHFQGHSAKP
ncbi:uncharacterized protein LOC131880944 [Tigriopus californicus]|uniref:uncharacterized protein LOC131880944 n=1 Tax=Tigriopus californicus TaxID=6832 RepID=UPI0027D9F11B|nr:uncharacterized protein LOC131880944 [Tigriopus californicus]